MWSLSIHDRPDVHNWMVLGLLPRMNGRLWILKVNPVVTVASLQPKMSPSELVHMVCRPDRMHIMHLFQIHRLICHASLARLTYTSITGCQQVVHGCSWEFWHALANHSTHQQNNHKHVILSSIVSSAIHEYCNMLIIIAEKFGNLSGGGRWGEHQVRCMEKMQGGCCPR